MGKCGSHWTLSWREPDSNSWSRFEKSPPYKTRYTESESFGRRERHHSGGNQKLESAETKNAPAQRFVPDSPLEGTGFELSVTGRETIVRGASHHRRRTWSVEYRNQGVDLWGMGRARRMV